MDKIVPWLRPHKKSYSTIVQLAMLTHKIFIGATSTDFDGYHYYICRNNENLRNATRPPT